MRVGELVLEPLGLHVPQHGAGPKHPRPIVLEPWQRSIAVDRHPRLLLRGLIQSDGWRGVNRIGRRYAYPRYMFSNRSEDIRNLFVDACRAVGVVATPTSRWQLSVARGDDVALLDTFIGPKT